MLTVILVVGAFVVGALAATAKEPQPPPPSKPLDAWTSEDVGAWIRRLGPAYDAYATEAERNGVNGPAFRSLSREAFGLLGVTSAVHTEVIVSNRARLA